MCSTVISECGRHILLSKKRKTDYIITEDNTADMMLVTASCEQCTQFLRDQTKHLHRALDGANLRAIQDRLAGVIFDMALDYVREHQVSLGMGGMRLMRYVVTTLISAMNSICVGVLIADEDEAI